MTIQPLRESPGTAHYPPVGYHSEDRLPYGVVRNKRKRVEEQNKWTRRLGSVQGVGMINNSKKDQRLEPPKSCRRNDLEWPFCFF